MKKRQNASIELISVHIPKTAGTSFRDTLLRTYGDEALVWDYDDTPLDPASLYNTDRNAWLLKSREFIEGFSSAKRVIHGHFPLQKYSEDFPNAKRITWVRHPIDRLISHYFMWKTRDDWPNHTLQVRVRRSQMDLAEFATIPILRNLMTRVFLENVPVSSLFFVGVQEYYRADMKELATRLGWRTVRFDQANVQRNHDYVALKRGVMSDSRLVSLLTDLNSEDMAFYESVVASRSSYSSGATLRRRLARLFRSVTL
ncbi:MAG: sulfotransferase family 2 domain-containing protein [Desulfomonilaceae bacterium]|nr:sulfotransferase family 2 domain-containing protein [Desulfomonilaceae bacterium]